MTTCHLKTGVESTPETSHVSNTPQSMENALLNVGITDQTLLQTRFDVFTAAKIQVEVFWVMTRCSVVVGCQFFGGPYCPHLLVSMDLTALMRDSA